MRRQLSILARRTVSSALAPHAHICRRCLAQAAVSPITSSDFIAPSSVPQQNQDLPISTPYVPSAATEKTTPISKSLKLKEQRAAFAKKYIGDSQGAELEEKERILSLLERDIEHDVPSQYLVPIDPAVLTRKETRQRTHLYRWAMAGHVDKDGLPKKSTARELKGIVVSAGLMDRTVKVRIPGQRWNTRIKKYYATHKDHLVHDPNNSLLEGDFVILHPLHVAKTVRHVIGKVVVPYGKPLHERPHIYTPEERLALYKEQRLAKAHRNKLRAYAEAGSEEAVLELRELGFDASTTQAKGKKKAANERAAVGPKAAAKKQSLKDQARHYVSQAKEKLDALHKAGLDTPNNVE